MVIIDALEKQMLDAVDGHRSIAKIVDRAGGDRLLPRARAFSKSCSGTTSDALESYP